MSDDLNLDIDAYEKDDLFNLFNITDFKNKKYIFAKYNNRRKSVETLADIDLKSKLQTFFDAAYYKLLSLFYEDKKNTTELAILNTEFNPPRQMHPAPDIIEPNINSTFQIKFPLGNINPIDKKIVSQILSLDTIFRNFDKNPFSNEFIYDLPNPLENVINMKLLSAEIPNSQYLYSENQENNKIIITMFNGKDTIIDGGGNEVFVDFPPEGKQLEIVIPDGSPGFGTLLSGIQNILNAQRNSFSMLQIGINNVSGRIFFRFKTLIECLTWNGQYYFSGGVQGVYPPDNLPPTGKFQLPSVDLLGVGQYDYLKRIYLGKLEADLRNISDATDPLTDSLVRDEGLTYKLNLNPFNTIFYRSLSWSLGFRKNEGILPLVTYDDTFVGFNILFNGYVSADAPYGDAEPDYVYLYVNEFVGNYNDTLNASLKDSFLAKSLLARIQINVSFFDVQFVENNGNEISILEKKRDYFGPVNIKRLHIKILNKFGELADLGDINYSLTFQFEQLYNSVRN